jgi:hypothetical protein
MASPQKKEKKKETKVEIAASSVSVSLDRSTGSIRKIEAAPIKTAKELGGCTLCKSQGHIRLPKGEHHNDVYCEFLRQAEKCAPNHEWRPHKYGKKKLRDYECLKCCQTLTGLFNVRVSVAGKFVQRWRDMAAWFKESKTPFEKTVHDDKEIITVEDESKYNPWRPNAEAMLAAVEDPKHAFALTGLPDNPLSCNVFLGCVLGSSASPIQSQLFGIKRVDLDGKRKGLSPVPTGDLKYVYCNAGAMAAHSWDRSIIAQTCLSLPRPVANFNISVFTDKNFPDRVAVKFCRPPIAVFNFSYDYNNNNSAPRVNLYSANEVNGYIAHVMVIRDTDPLQTPYLVFASVYPTPPFWKAAMKTDIIPLETAVSGKRKAEETMDNKDGFVMPASKKPRVA